MHVLVACKYKNDRITNNRERWSHCFPHYKSMGAFFCHGNHSFDPTCPQNLMQPFPYPSDATHRIRSRLAEWLQRYSSLKVWTTTDGRRTIGTMYTISSHCEPSEGVRLGCSNPPFSTFYFIFMGNFEHKLCKLIKSNPPLQI